MTTSTPGPADAAFRPPSGPGSTTVPLPRIGEIIRDVERLAVQAQAILDRPVDPASLPTNEHLRSTVEVHRLLTGFHLERVLQELAALASVALPAVGSAVPVRFPTTHPAPPPGEKPTPGSATAVAPAVRESPGVGVAPGAGDSSRPAPGPGFLPGPGEKTTYLARHRIQRALRLPPRWPLRIR